MRYSLRKCTSLMGVYAAQVVLKIHNLGEYVAELRMHYLKNNVNLVGGF